jgi:hypothetical protein
MSRLLKGGVAMNGKLLAAAVLLGVSAMSQPVLSAESEFQITPRIGVGELRIDRFVGVRDEEITTSTHGIGVSFGFLTPTGIVGEVGAETFGDFDLFDTFDSHELTQQFVSLGYQFELGDGWRIVPRAGRARWKLRSEEGLLFNPGPEETREVRGYEYFWELSVARRVSRTVTLGLNYKQGSYEFGRSQSAAFLVTLGF